MQRATDHSRPATLRPGAIGLLNAADAPGRVLSEDPPSRGSLVGEAMECRTLAESVARFSEREADWPRRRAKWDRPAGSRPRRSW